MEKSVHFLLISGYVDIASVNFLFKVLLFILLSVFIVFVFLALLWHLIELLKLIVRQGIFLDVLLLRLYVLDISLVLSKELLSISLEKYLILLIILLIPIELGPNACLTDNVKQLLINWLRFRVDGTILIQKILTDLQLLFDAQCDYE